MGSVLGDGLFHHAAGIFPGIGGTWACARKLTAPLLFALMLVTALAIGSDRAAAQDESADLDALQKQYDAAFQEIFKDPGNLDKSFQYAELAVKLGNFEAAISALERMLLINPNLPRVRLELGVLYFRLGSYQLAKSYLTRAIEVDNVPDEVRSRVGTYLAEVDKRLSRHQFSGSLFGGVRYQSNAIAGPTNSDVLVAGISSTLDDEFVTRSDGNIFAAGSFRHGHDLLTQGGTFIETNGTGFWSIQEDEKQLNLIYLSLQTGPRLRFLTEYLDNATSRPYVVASIIWLGNDPYLHEVGLGWNVTHQFSERFAGEANIERKQKYYDSSVERANAKDQEGPTSQLRLTGRYALWPNITLNGLAIATRESARQDFESNWEWGLTVGLATFYQQPVSLFGIGGGPWSTSFSTARVISDYDIPTRRWTRTTSASTRNGASLWCRPFP